MNIRTSVQLTIQDTRTGKMIHHHRRRSFPSHSYLRGFLHILFAQMYQGSMGTLDTGNVSRAVVQHANNLDIKAAISVSLFGLVIGKGSDAVLVTNYKLQTQCLQGSALDQLLHGVVTFDDYALYNNSLRFRANRTFTNDSGLEIALRECGIYCRATVTPYYFCIVRDILPEVIWLQPGQTITLRYKISVTA